MLRLAIILATVAVQALFADSPFIEMTSEHSVIPQSPFVIVYVTLHNRTVKPIDVITCLPNIGASSRGGKWMLMIQSSIYGYESDDHIPIKSRLLPVSIPPNKAITFSERIPIAFNPAIDSNTFVEVQYKVSDGDAKRYDVWGGVLVTRSTFAPFYKTK